MLKPSDFIRNTFLVNRKETSNALEGCKGRKNPNTEFLEKRNIKQSQKELHKILLERPIEQLDIPASRIQTGSMEMQAGNVEKQEIVNTQAILNLINDEGSTIKQIYNVGDSGEKVISIADKDGVNHMVPLYKDGGSFQNDKNYLEPTISGGLDGHILKPIEGEQNEVLLLASNKLAEQMRKEFQSDDWKIVKEKEAYDPRSSFAAKHFLFQLKKDDRSAKNVFKLPTYIEDKFMKKILRDKVYDTEFDRLYTYEDLTASIPFDTKLPMLIESIQLTDADGNETLVYKGPNANADAISSELLYDNSCMNLYDASSRVPFAQELLQIIGAKGSVSSKNREYYYNPMGTFLPDRVIKEYGREPNFTKVNDSLL
ncbi:MAG: hypothetical protein HRT47_12990 [Candidatus Caenarcaniphilales bacterium]|nr:hypothetical protein [Candidatus Caenarcaniphilales bacterium]